jgi:hypothetical protein
LVAVRRFDSPYIVQLAVAAKATTFCIALVLPVSAHAGLDTSAPEGIDLTGIWTIDPKRSEDPKEALQKLREQGKVRGRIGMGGISGMGGLGGMGSQRPGSTEDHEAMREQMEQRLAISKRIEIMQIPQAVELNLGDRFVSCTSTEKSQVPMPDGELADRLCGWDDDEFVVELQGPSGFHRTDRYSRGDDGQTLVVTTSLKGGRIPELKFKSVYVRSESGT